jgi:hypothetical protein
MTEIVVGRADWRNFDHLLEAAVGVHKEEVERDPTLAITSPDQAARLAYLTQESLFDSTTMVLMAYLAEEPIGYMVLEVGDFVGFHDRGRNPCQRVLRPTGVPSWGRRSKNASCRI